eukprot:gene3245-6422_t
MFQLSDIIFILSVIFVGVGFMYPIFVVLAFIVLLIPLGSFFYLNTDTLISLLEPFPDKIELEPTEIPIHPATNLVEIQTNVQSITSLPSNNLDLGVQAESKLETESKSETEETKSEETTIENWGIPTLCVKDINGKIITVNSPKPVPIESDYFKGHIVFMVRTDGDLAQYNTYEHHFHGRQRKFEIQIQGQLKKLPEGTLIMGGEIPQKMVLGVITRTLIYMIMKFCVKLISNLRFSFGDDVTADGRYETAHIAFPLYRAMDRVVETPPDSTPPPLGQELPETDAERNLRRASKTPDIVYKLGYTYSFSFHSMYIDFSKWKLCSVPGYKFIDLQTFINDQPLHIVVYEIKEQPIDNKAPGQIVPHYVCDRKYLSKFEIVHISNMKTNTNINNQSNSTVERISSSSPSSSISSPPSIPLHIVTTMTNEEEDDEDIPDESRFDSTLTLTQQDPILAERFSTSTSSSTTKQLNIQHPLHMCVHSNSKIPLLVLPTAWEGFHEDEQSVVMAALSNGTNHRTEGFIGLGESKKLGLAIKEEDIIRNGDIILLQGVNSKRYLRVFRGWWLRWSNHSDSEGDSGGSSSSDISIKNCFVITIRSPVSAISAKIGQPLGYSTPFHLRPYRYPSFKVGCYASDSYEHGGALLGLYKTTITKNNMTQPALWLNGTKINPLYLYTVDIGQTNNIQPNSSTGNDATNSSKDSHDIISSPNKSSSSSPLASSSSLVFVSNSIFESLQSPTHDELLSLEIHVIGWLEMNHISSKLPLRQFIIVSSMNTLSEGRKTWTSLRSEEDFIGPFRYLRNVLATHETGVNTNNSSKGSNDDSSNNGDGKGDGDGSMSSKGHKRGPDIGVHILSNAIHSLMSIHDDNDKGSGKTDDNINGNNNGNKVYSDRLQQEQQSQQGSDPCDPDDPLTSGTTESHSHSQSRSLPSLSSLNDLLPLTNDDSIDSTIAFVGNDNDDMIISHTEGKEAEEGDVEDKEESDHGNSTELSSHLIRRVLLSILGRKELLDDALLKGGSSERIPYGNNEKEKLLPKLSLCTIRALWDSHWRQEIVQIFPSFIGFHLPYLTPIDWKYIPGFHIIRLETMGKIHYLAFKDILIKEDFITCLLFQISRISGSDNIHIPRGINRGDPRNDFILHNAKWTPNNRIILNARLFLFDNNSLDNYSHFTYEESLGSHDSNGNSSCNSNNIDNYNHNSCVNGNNDSNLEAGCGDGGESYWDFSSRLLRLVAALDPSCCDEPQSLIFFLNETVSLHRIDLSAIDYSSVSAVCFFVNIFHTLLLHARLLLNIPKGSNWGHFFSVVSYEIGSDVFSLQEIEQCILRGKLSLPSYIPQYWPCTLPLTDEHYKYSVLKSDQRMNFLINSGSISMPPIIFLVTPNTLFIKLRECSQLVLSHSIRIDNKKNIIILPKICEIYCNDFGGDPLTISKHCLRYLNQNQWEELSRAISDVNNPPILKFREFTLESHARLAKASFGTK